MLNHAKRAAQRLDGSLRGRDLVALQPRLGLQPVQVLDHAGQLALADGDAVAEPVGFERVHTSYCSAVCSTAAASA